MISEEVIRKRSYLIWQRLGCPHGRSLQHWLEARAELERELEQSDFPPVIFSCDRNHDVVPHAHVSPRPLHMTARRIPRAEPGATLHAQSMAAAETHAAPRETRQHDRSK
jgi:hypothetical protein